jgi:glycosyltransferase involved in cell wall biosynthesis
MGATLFVRAAIQRRSIKRARLVICISSVFRDHLIRDYGIDRAATRVIPNPIDLSRFGEPRDGVGEPAVVLVLGRIAVRKGIDQIVDLSHILAERGAAVRIRILGSGGLWSDYRPLLVDVDASVATYGGGVAESDVPAELHRSDVLIQASKYEPFALTVGEALASGVPVVATTEVGAIEGTSPMATEVVAPGDAEALADGLEKILKRLRGDVRGVRLAARSDAERLFAPETVCAQISDALRDLVAADRRTQSAPSDEATANATPSR